MMIGTTRYYLRYRWVGRMNGRFLVLFSRIEVYIVKNANHLQLQFRDDGGFSSGFVGVEAGALTSLAVTITFTSHTCSLLSIVAVAVNSRRFTTESSSSSSRR